MKIWEMMIGGYNWRVKSGPSSKIGERMPIGTFEGCGDVVRWPQKNVRDNVKESWKNRLLKHD